VGLDVRLQASHPALAEPRHTRELALEPGRLQLSVKGRLATR